MNKRIMDVCLNCMGDGVCPYCGGFGEVPAEGRLEFMCRECDGIGDCWACQGTGLEEAEEQEQDEE
jgi:hypothetical protein